MRKYTVRAVAESGAFLFGLTLECPDEETARRRFEALPCPPCRAELLHRGKVVATHTFGPRPAVTKSL